MSRRRVRNRRSAPDLDVRAYLTPGTQMLVPPGGTESLYTIPLTVTVAAAQTIISPRG